MEEQMPVSGDGKKTPKCMHCQIHHDVQNVKEHICQYKSKEHGRICRHCFILGARSKINRAKAVLSNSHTFPTETQELMMNEGIHKLKQTILNLQDDEQRQRVVDALILTDYI